MPKKLLKKRPPAAEPPAEPPAAPSNDTPSNDTLAHNRPIAQLIDGVYHFRASSLKSPACQLLNSLSGISADTPPPDLQKRFDDGKHAEQIIIDRLRDLGWDIMDGDQQTRIQWKIGSKIIVGGHTDGVGVPKSNVRQAGAHVIEIKAFSESSMQQARRKGVGSLFGYDWQLTPYMLETGKPGMWVCGQKEFDKDGSLTGIGELWFEEVLEPPIPKAEIVKKLRAVVKAHEEGVDPMADCPALYPCSFHFLHTKPATPEVDAHPDVDVQHRIDNLAAEYREFQAGAKNALEELKDILGDRAGIRGQYYRITRSVTTRRNVDYDQIERDGLGEKYITVSESSRVNIQEVR